MNLSLRQFSQNLHPLNGIMWGYSIRNSTKVSQDLWKVQVEGYTVTESILAKRMFIKQLFVYNFCTEFHDSQGHRWADMVSIYGVLLFTF
jgi:hypothetical protein